MFVTTLLDVSTLSSVIIVTVLAENIDNDALIVATTVSFDGLATLDKSASLSNTEF
jgi:hypothetical protein